MDRFIVDVMLGKLAKWLRIFGFDSIYSSKMTDNEIIYLSRKENRIVITRDKELFNRLEPNLRVFINSDKPLNQFVQLKSLLNLKIDKSLILSRCSLCNSELILVNKELAKDKVPPFIYNRHNIFKYCRTCDKFYWQGSHIDRIFNLISKVEKKLSSF